MDSDAEQGWRQLAERHWLKSSGKPGKVRPDVLKKEIWDVLEREGFSIHNLLELDNLQFLEK
jgi:intron-binding protein aquarius